VQGATYWIEVIYFAAVLLGLAVGVVYLVARVLGAVAGPFSRPRTHIVKLQLPPYEAGQPASSSATGHVPHHSSKSSVAHQDALSERKLLNACAGDRQLAERLVKYELQRLPRLSRPDAVQLAMERLWEDRRD
jgi:hypothetical protein